MTTPASFIRAHTVASAPPLVPEIELHLARDSREIFQEADDYERAGERWRPYWAFAWPGGQALARHILDNPTLVKGCRVADIGAGSGIAAIAARMAGAREATAFDPDPLAGAVAGLNARHNDIEMSVRVEDPLGEAPDADLILIGDLVYEPELETRVTGFLEAARRNGTRVLFGDRTTSRRPPLGFSLLGEYRAPLSPALEESHIEHARVWILDPAPGQRSRAR